MIMLIINILFLVYLLSAYFVDYPRLLENSVRGCFYAFSVVLTVLLVKTNKKNKKVA